MASVNKLVSWWKAHNVWHLNCEQAKYVAQGMRIVGLGYFAAFGYQPIIGFFHHVPRDMTMSAVTKAVAVIAFWFFCEYVGYSALKEGCLQ